MNTAIKHSVEIGGFDLAVPTTIQQPRAAYTHLPEGPTSLGKKEHLTKLSKQSTLNSVPCEVYSSQNHVSMPEALLVGYLLFQVRQGMIRLSLNANMGEHCRLYIHVTSSKPKISDMKLNFFSINKPASNSSLPISFSTFITSKAYITISNSV